jgi:hypothetical protein
VGTDPSPDRKNVSFVALSGCASSAGHDFPGIVAYANSIEAHEPFSKRWPSAYRPHPAYVGENANHSPLIASSSLPPRRDILPISLRSAEIRALKGDLIVCKLSTASGQALA